MRTLLLASAALLLAGGTGFAQNATGNPKSGTASNITQADTRSDLAPALPTPGAAGSARDYLMRAQQALQANRTGEAQEALERAETRLLDRSTAPEAANQPDTNPRVDAVRKALMALGHKDRKGAMDAIQMAMAGGGGSDESGAAPMPATATGEPMGTMPAPAAAMPPAGSGPASSNGVPVNAMGGTNSPSGAQSAPGPLAQ